ncbi:MAG TPA: c-type cytochrome domain-containing protein, partial [Gemmataceae bacterium]|nr:c-type cytochrome domain-containing protein [Gemmataceae bacterium]
MIPNHPACGHNFLLFGLASLVVLNRCAAVAAAEAAPSFARDIAPLLTTQCLKCHSGARAKGELDLTSRDHLLAGGDSGSVLTPGKAAESLLFEYVRDKKMPPRKPLNETQIELLRRWIDAGAVWKGPALTPP